MSKREIVRRKNHRQKRVHGGMTNQKQGEDETKRMQEREKEEKSRKENESRSARAKVDTAQKSMPVKAEAGSDCVLPNARFDPAMRRSNAPV